MQQQTSATSSSMRPPPPLLNNSTSGPSTARRKYSVFSIDSAPFAPTSSSPSSLLSSASPLSSPSPSHAITTATSSVHARLTPIANVKREPSFATRHPATKVDHSGKTRLSESLSSVDSHSTSVAPSNNGSVGVGRGRPMANRDLEQHISKLISENAAIVQTFDPLWSKRSFGRSKANGSAATGTVPTSLSMTTATLTTTHHSNSNRRYSEYSMSNSSSSQSKLASALLGQPSSMSSANNAFTATSVRTSPTSPIAAFANRKYSEGQLGSFRSHRSLSLVTPPHPPLHYSHPAMLPYLPLSNAFNPFAANSLMQNMMATAHTTPTIKVTPAPLDHPDNPEGSIIKDLLLKCRQQEAFAASSQAQLFESLSPSTPYSMPIIPTAMSPPNHLPHSLSYNQLVPSRKTSVSLPFLNSGSNGDLSSILSPSTLLQLSTASSPIANSTAAPVQMLPPEVQSSLNIAFRYPDSNLNNTLRVNSSSLAVANAVASSISTLDHYPKMSLKRKSSADTLAVPSAASVLSTIGSSSSLASMPTDPDELSMLVYVCTICRIAFRKKENLEIHQLHYCRQNPNMTSDAFKFDNSFVSGDFPSSASFGSLLKKQFAAQTSSAASIATAADLTLPKKRKISEPVFPSSTFNCHPSSHAPSTSTTGSIYYYDHVDSNAPTFTRKISVLQQPNKPPLMIHLKRPVFKYSPPDHLQHVAGQPAPLTSAHFVKGHSIDQAINVPSPMTCNRSILDVRLGSLKPNDLHVIPDYLLHFNRKVSTHIPLVFPFLQNLLAQSAEVCDFFVDVKPNPTIGSVQDRVHALSMAELQIESLERNVKPIVCDSDEQSLEHLTEKSIAEHLVRLSDTVSAFRLRCSQQLQESDLQSKQLADQRSKDGRVYAYSLLPTSTRVTFCCSLQVQPAHTQHQPLFMTSVYSSWLCLPPLDLTVREHSISMLLSSYNSSRKTRMFDGYLLASPTDIALKLIDTRTFVRKSLKSERSELRKRLKDYKKDFCEVSFVCSI
jgi:hypothetical protein